MAKYIVDLKIKANLRAFIEHDSEQEAIKAVESEMLSIIPDELGDFVFELIEVTGKEAELSYDEEASK